MTANIVRDPRLVHDRLQQEFGIERQHLVEIVKAAVAARARSTDDSPRSAGSFYAWAEATTMLRQVFRRLGWDKNDENGVETVIHHERKLQIAIMSTDHRTANDESRSPRNRTIKGTASEYLVDLNNQYELFPNRRELGPSSEPTRSLWYLCIYDDGSNVRAELSKPVEFAAGYITKFSDRIFILQVSDWEETILSLPDDEDPDQDNLDVDVRRK